MLSALKAFVLVAQEKEDIALALLTPYEIAAGTAFTLLTDTPFSMVTDAFESCEEIKDKITGTTKNSLVEKLASPLANCFGKGYITYIGTSSHVLGHSADLLLLIPPQIFIHLFKNNKPAFGALVATYSCVAAFMIFFNAIQTYTFETHAGLKNLKEIQHGRESTPLLLSDDNKLKVSERCYCFFKKGLLSQAPLHGLADAMTVIVFLRMMLTKLNPTTQALAIVIPALLQFIASTFGNYESEVKSAIMQLAIKSKLWKPIQRSDTPLLPLSFRATQSAPP